MAQHQCHQSLLPSREHRGRDRERSAPCTLLHPKPPAASSIELVSPRLYARELSNYGFILTHLSACNISSLRQMDTFCTCYMEIIGDAQVLEKTCFTLPITDSTGFFALPIIPSCSPAFPSSIFYLTKGVEDPHHNQSW